MVGLREQEVTNSLQLKFTEAVKSNDITGAKALLLTCPEQETWPENPLHDACKHGSRRMVKAIAEAWPKLARSANQNGDMAMHIVSARGNIKMVQFLENLNPGSCLVENNDSMIPLHMAVEKGHCHVIRKLVSLCPESLKKLTSKQETVFHVAVNNSQRGAFQVLVEEARKLNLGHILNNKNNEGNTVLHVAAEKGLTHIVNLLLPESSSSSSHIKIQVNTKNKRGLTALEMCPVASREISLILRKAADDESQHKSRVVAALTRLPVATRNVLLAVLIMIAVVTFTVTFDLPDDLLKEIYRSSLKLHYATASDVISGRLPSVIYLMIFNTAGFMICMLLISYLLWPLPLTSIVLSAVACTCIVFSILVNKIVPKLSIRVGNFSFSSIALVWSSAFAIIVCAVTVNKMCRLCSSGD